MNSSFKYYSYLYKKKRISYKDLFHSLKYLVKYSWFNLSPTDLHENVFNRFLKGRSVDFVFDFVDEFLDKNLNSFLNQKTFSFLKKALLEKDSLIFILSNSPSYLVKPIAERLGVKNALGSDYEIDSNGEFLKVKTVMDGFAKAEFVKNHVRNKEHKVVFTDSIWDKPLLDIANECYAVNPDKKLFSLAKQKGWNIVE